MKIYGNSQSGPCLKIKYVLELLGCEYEWVETEFDKLKTPEHLKLHPAGKVPAMDDDGFVLFESNAICKYLCRKLDHGLYPKELKKLALVDQWIDFSMLHVGNAMSKVAFNRVFAPKMDVPVDEQSLKDGLAWLDRYLPIVNNQLSKTQYLANDFSLADITLLATLSYAEVAQIDLTKYEHLSKWLGNVKGMEFYKK
jgi:glutathione S-transferase